ncbi:thioredoxin family protein [Candidatus Fermentibacteria bacterium]|nr:thioredoxin family protein [Candidatus Fermentibacteria bacterium]
MTLATRSVLALIATLGLAALFLSCGPRDHSGNPGTVAAAHRDPPPAPTPPTPPAADTVEADSGTTVPAAAAVDVPPRQIAAPAHPAVPSPPAPSHSPKPAALPRLVDLGADKCVPCKMMAPILGELKRDYADQFGVEVIDVWKDSAPGRAYGIRVIPTQIFFDASGKELWRHEGFMGKEDILKKWAELGVTLRPPRG